MKVLIVSTFPPRRCGIGDYTADLSHELARHSGLQVSVLTYEDGVRKSPDLGNRVQVLRDLKTRSTPRQLSALLQRLGPDLVHLQSSTFLHSPSLNTSLARAITKPLLTTVHDTPGSWRTFYVIPSLRRVYKRSHLLIAHSPGVSKTLARFHGIGRNGIMEMPLGVNTAMYHPKADGQEAKVRYRLRDKRIVLFFGFLRPGKGLEMLLEAWARIRNTGGDLVLVVAGGTPTDARRYSFLLRSEASYPTTLKKLASRLGIARSTVFTGYVPEDMVPGLLAEAEVIVLPYDGIPSQSYPLLKALASGRPVIATRVSGFKDLLEDGKDGLLIHPGSIDSLVEALSFLIGNPAMAHALGSNARRKAERDLDVSSLARRTLRTYSAALEDD